MARFKWGLVAVLVAAGVARADSVTIYAGSLGSFSATAAQSGFYAGNGSPGVINPVDAIAEFSLAGLSDTTIQSATFELTTSAVTTSPTNTAVYGYAGDGVASTSDFEQGSLLADLGQVGVGQQLNVDATTFVQSLVSSQSGFAGFDVRDVQPFDGNYGNLGDVNFATYYYPPYFVEYPTLVINYTEGAPVSTTTPLPSACPAGIALLGAGALLYAFRRRKLQVGV